jgi:hypothetical protein
MSSFNQDTRESIVVAGSLCSLSRRTYNHAKIALLNVDASTGW